MLFGSFIIYIFLGNVLDAEAVFVSMSLFNTLRLTMTYFFPMAVSQGSELLVVFKRVQVSLNIEKTSFDCLLFRHFYFLKKTKLLQTIIRQKIQKMSM